MTRDDWLDQFTDELIKLRQHLTAKFARTLALQSYDEKAHPRVKAREYDASLRPKPGPAGKQSKWGR